MGINITDATGNPVETDSAREALARQWLGPNVDGVDLFVPTRYLRGNALGPVFVKIRINTEFLALLFRRHDICESESSVMVQELAPAAWDTNVDYPINTWHLEVGDEIFQFVGNKNVEMADCGFESQSMVTSYLDTWLSGTPARDDCSDIFRWVGGSLFCANVDVDVDSFVKSVLAICPEIAARETAKQMAAQIVQSGVGGLVVAHGARERSRHRV